MLVVGGWRPWRQRWAMVTHGEDAGAVRTHGTRVRAPEAWLLCRPPVVPQTPVPLARLCAPAHCLHRPLPPFLPGPWPSADALGGPLGSPGRAAGQAQMRPHACCSWMPGVLSHGPAAVLPAGSQWAGSPAPPTAGQWLCPLGSFPPQNSFAAPSWFFGSCFKPLSGRTSAPGSCCWAGQVWPAPWHCWKTCLGSRPALLPSMLGLQPPRDNPVLPHLAFCAF